LIDGLVVVDKPAGWTSHDVVGRLRRVYGQRRVGHAGTLDPDATGVLLVGLGRVTRLLRYLQDAGKGYHGIVVFGRSTTTLDASGDVVEERAMPVTRDDVERAAAAFVGDIEQIPPMVSAIKVDGRRLYEVARAGGEVERAPRKVHIERLDVVGFEPGDEPRAAIAVDCSSGTYIRSLAADLGSALGGPAHLGSLRRTRVSSFTLDEASELAVIEADPAAAVLAPIVAVRDLPRVDVDEDRARAVSHGAVLPTRDLGDGLQERSVAVAGPDGNLLAVYDVSRVAARPEVVLSGS
jgi:tRNA pseudouridine55 synthase